MSFAERHVLETLVYLPMLTAAVLVMLPFGWRALARWISIGSALALLLASLYVFFVFDRSAEGFQLVRVLPWFEPLGIDFRLGVDGLAVLMVLLTGIVAFSGAIIAANVERETKSYYVLLFTLIAGV